MSDQARIVQIAAREYLLLGWRVVPVPAGRKAPVLDDWPNLRLEDADLESAFSKMENVGILTGQPSSGLVDVDLDCPQAQALAKQFLPGTARIHGRPSNPRSHYWYVCREIPQSATFKALDGTALVELRSTGQQTLAPPSLHPTGEQLLWEQGGAPSRMDGYELRWCVARLAAAALLARLWPRPGSRHDAALALAGALLRWGWTEDEVTSFVGAVAEAACDEEAPARRRDVAATGRRLAENRSATGLPSLKALFGQNVVLRVSSWLGVEQNAKLTGNLAAAEAQGTIVPRQHLAQPVLIRLADVTPKPVRWLWPGRIPLGKVTVLDGDPGLGKSLLTLDLAARVTQGLPMADGAPSDLAGPRGVVLLTAEDDPEDTVRTRLDVAEADAGRVVLLVGVKDLQGERMPTIADLDALGAAITEANAGLAIIDPLMAYVPDGRDAHRDQDIRRALAPLARLAASSRVAIVVVRHLNKSGAGNPLYRGGGSIGIIGAARSGLLVAPDPEVPGRRILAVTKANLAATPPALAYRVIEERGVPRILWDGEVSYTTASLLAAPDSERERSALEVAEQFLRDVLAERAVAAKEVQKEAKEAGIRERTLWRAKTKIGVVARKDGFAGGWVWEILRSKSANTAEDCHATEGDSLRHPRQPSASKTTSLAGEASGLPKELPLLARMAVDIFGAEVLSIQAAQPASPCRACGRTEFWVSTWEETICARCHPPADLTLVRRWCVRQPSGRWVSVQPDTEINGSSPHRLGQLGLPPGEGRDA